MANRLVNREVVGTPCLATRVNRSLYKRQRQVVIDMRVHAQQHVLDD
jgi:hypothetical protein